MQVAKARASAFRECYPQCTPKCVCFRLFSRTTGFSLNFSTKLTFVWAPRVSSSARWWLSVGGGSAAVGGGGASSPNGRPRVVWAAGRGCRSRPQTAAKNKPTLVCEVDVSKSLILPLVDPIHSICQSLLRKWDSNLDQGELSAAISISVGKLMLVVQMGPGRRRGMAKPTTLPMWKGHAIFHMNECR